MSWYTVLVIIVLCLVAVSSPAGADAEGGSQDGMRAFFMSFCVPGLGQYYVGSPGYAKFFIVAELAIWGGYYYNTSMKHGSRHDYYSHAALHAGVNPSGHGASYLNAVGSYNSSYDYNMRRRQMSFDPVLYSGGQSWQWDSEVNR
ncbi:MAG: hypothetical protein J7M24_06985, partial [Candidatus Latescibacteria bacterium]|nr:hypothetical protein [Candidatus Latescibacterota bacterium]